MTFSSDGEDDEKEQVGAGANLGFAAASTLGRRKNPIKQLPWSKGKQQLVTIISLAMMIIYVAKMMVVVAIRRRRSRSMSRRIRRIRRGTGRGRLVITGPKNEWPAWQWVNQALQLREIKLPSKSKQISNIDHPGYTEHQGPGGIGG